MYIKKYTFVDIKGTRDWGVLFLVLIDQSRSFIYNFGVCVTAPEPEKFNFGGFNKNHEKCQFYILFLTTADILEWFNKVLYTGNFHIIVYSCQLELLRKTKYLNYSFIKCFLFYFFKVTISGVRTCIDGAKIRTEKSGGEIY